MAIPSFSILHHSLFINLVLDISRIQSCIWADHLEYITLLDPYPLEFLQDSSLRHLFPESLFCLIIASRKHPDQLSESFIDNLPYVDVLCISLSDISSVDQNAFFLFADVLDGVLSMFLLMMRDILDMINFVHISFPEHLYTPLEPFIDAIMSSRRNRKRMLLKHLLGNGGSDFFFFEELKDLIPELLLVFLENVLVIDEIVFVDQEHDSFLKDRLALVIDI